MQDKIRDLIKQQKVVPMSAEAIAIEADLYEMGMSSFGSVQLMLALEDMFDIEFPERMLNRKTFATLATIDSSVKELIAARG